MFLKRLLLVYCLVGLTKAFAGGGWGGEGFLSSLTLELEIIRDQVQLAVDDKGSCNTSTTAVAITDAVQSFIADYAKYVENSGNPSSIPKILFSVPEKNCLDQSLNQAKGLTSANVVLVESYFTDQPSR